MPMVRPSRRCRYSSQKMSLNSSTPKAEFTFWNSGLCWYISKTRCHSASPIGGRTPINGRQSTIDRPDPVRRVKPPRTTMTNTSPQQIRSHMATARFCAWLLTSVFIDKGACGFLGKAGNFSRPGTKIAAENLPAPNESCQPLSCAGPRVVEPIVTWWTSKSGYNGRFPSRYRPMPAPATALYDHNKYWAECFGTAAQLPMSRAEMDVLGWDSCDIIIVT